LARIRLPVRSAEKSRAGGLTGSRKTFGGEADPHSGGTVLVKQAW